MKAILPGLFFALIIGVTMILFGGPAARLRESGRALARLVSWLTRTAACSLLFGLMAAVLAQHAELDALMTGILVGLLSLPIALLIVRPKRSQDEAKSSSTVALKAKVVADKSPIRPLPTRSKTSRRFWFRLHAPSHTADQALDGAWEVAGSLADWAPSRVASVRTSCAALLREAHLAPLDMDMKDLEVLIRRRIPELVGACAEQCRDATPSERESLVEDMLESLESVGAEADRHRKQARRSHNTRFDILRAHIANRVRKEGWL